MNIDKTIINNVKQICKQKNITMNDFIKKISKKNKNLAKILKLESKQKLTISDLEILANFLNVDIINFFESKK